MRDNASALRSGWSAPTAPRAARLSSLLIPTVGGVLLIGLWQLAFRLSKTTLLPGPLEVLTALGELVSRGLLFKYAAASLFRVTWGFLGAVAIGWPTGLLLGWYRPAFSAVNPLVQVLRPISPIAWIPLAILWFGISEGAPIFLIFMASVFPIVVTAAAAVRAIPPVYLRAAANFGLTGRALFRAVIFPATLPQVITGLRIALGVSWMVVVAAEMIAVDSGLGYLIIDARNAGKRYDLVVAGMLCIGLVGLGLDLALRWVERSKGVQYGDTSFAK